MKEDSWRKPAAVGDELHDRLDPVRRLRAGVSVPEPPIPDDRKRRDQQHGEDRESPMRFIPAPLISRASLPSRCIRHRSRRADATHQPAGAGIYVSSAQQLSCSFTERVFGLHIAGEPRIASNINGAGQMDKLPFTIEILEFEDERSVVIDRVIGGSVYFEEAKRIGQHLLSIVDAGTRPRGYRVVSNNHELVYTWRSGDGG